MDYLVIGHPTSISGPLIARHQKHCFFLHLYVKLLKLEGFYFCFLRFIYLFERKHTCTCEKGEEQRERDKQTQLSMESGVGLYPMNLRYDWIQNQELDTQLD